MTTHSHCAWTNEGGHVNQIKIFFISEARDCESIQCTKQANIYNYKMDGIVILNLLALLLIKRCIALISLDQVVMITLLNQTALIHHKDQITTLDRTQPVGNEEHRSPLCPGLKIEA